VNCVAALKTDSYSKQLLRQAKSSKEPLAREMAIKALGMSGTVPSNHLKTVNGELINIFLNEDMGTVERSVAFNAMNLDKVSSESLLARLGLGDKDVSSFVSQKLHQTVVKNGSEIRDNNIYNYDFLSLPNAAQSVFVAKDIAKIERAQVGFEFSLLMKGNALKRTSFVFKTEEDGNGNEIIRLDSQVGGLSSYVGETDPADDTDPNASVHLSIFGLPLRPFVLFSSFSDLFDMYMSGAGEKLTSFLSGSVMLLDREESFPLGNGLNLRILVTAAVSFDFSGKAEISIWTQNGKTHIENSGVVVVNLEAAVEKDFLGFQKSFAAEGMLDVDTDVNAGGNPVTACVRMSQRDTKLTMTETESFLGEKKSSHRSLVMPGITWNLNMKNNHMCNTMLRP